MAKTNLPITKFGKPLDMRVLKRGIDWRKEIAGDQKILAERFKAHLMSLDFCPICKSTHFSTYVIVFGYQYSMCQSCGHIYCATPPLEFAIAELYSSESKLKSVQSKIYLDEELFNIRADSIALPKVRFIIDALKAVTDVTPSCWVDVGSGAGEVLHAVRNSGIRAFGIESDCEECRFARSKGLIVSNEYLSDENSSELLKEAQIVSFFNVLEHIALPRRLIDLVSKEISKGFLVFEVPRHPSISSLSTELFPDMACRHIYPPDHLHVFSENSIRSLLLDSGFEIVAKWYFGQDFFDLISSAAANQGISSNSVWSEVAQIAPKLQQVIDEGGLSDSVLIVASKGFK